MSAKTYTKDLPITELTIDPQFAALFPQDSALVAHLAADMASNGYDEARPIDVWREGNGPLVVVEGHQRLAAAKKVGVETIRVAYRHFEDRNEALVWSAEQQNFRRNVSKEAIALALVQALQQTGELEDETLESLSKRFKLAVPTFARARIVATRGTNTEVAAVLDGKHGLKTAYKEIQARERAEAQPIDDRPPQPPTPRVEPEEEEPDLEAELDMAELERVREALSDVGNAYDNADTFYSASQEQVAGSMPEFRSGLLLDLKDAVEKARDAQRDLEAALLDE